MPKKPVRLSFIFLAVIGTLFTTYLLAEISLRILAPVLPFYLRVFIQEEAPNLNKSCLRVAHHLQIILEEDFFAEDFDVIVVGDSMVFGSMVARDDTFTALLSKETGLKVLNLGMPGRGLCANNQMIRYALANQKNAPSFVLYSIFANDLVEGKCGQRSNKDLFVKERDYRSNLKLQIRAVREKVLGRSVFYQLLKRLLTYNRLQFIPYRTDLHCKNNNLEFLFVSPSYLEPFLSLQDELTKRGFKYAISKVKSAKLMAEKAGSNFIVILLPFKEQIYVPLFIERGLLPASAYSGCYNTTYDELYRKIKAEGVQVIDLRPTFIKGARENKKLFWIIDGHFTPEGHKLIANELSDALREDSRDIIR